MRSNKVHDHGAKWGRNKKSAGTFKTVHQFFSNIDIDFNSSTFIENIPQTIGFNARS